MRRREARPLVRAPPWTTLDFRTSQLRDEGMTGVTQHANISRIHRRSTLPVSTAILSPPSEPASKRGRAEPGPSRRRRRRRGRRHARARPKKAKRRPKKGKDRVQRGKSVWDVNQPLDRSIHISGRAPPDAGSGMDNGSPNCEFASFARSSPLLRRESRSVRAGASPVRITSSTGVPPVRVMPAWSPYLWWSENNRCRQDWNMAV